VTDINFQQNPMERPSSCPSSSSIYYDNMTLQPGMSKSAVFG